MLNILVVAAAVFASLASAVSVQAQQARVETQTRVVQARVPRAVTPAPQAPQLVRPAAAQRGVLNAAPSTAASNDWTVGIAAGQLEGTYLRYAADMARVLDDVPNLRVVPMVTYGASSNIEDLLYLRGIDLAFTQADMLDHLRNDNRFRDMTTRINYVMPLFISEFHVLARPEIKTLADLNGKTVGANVKGSAAALTARTIFDRLGIKVNFVNMPHPIALEKMKTGEIAALVHSVGKPNDFFAKTKFEPGFHLVPVEFNETLAEYYVPATITGDDYPSLIPKGQTINTVAVTNVLAAFNWPASSERGRRLARFVERLFTRFDEFHKAQYQPKWKEMNLAGKVPGWSRLPAAEEVLLRMEQAGMATGR